MQLGKFTSTTIPEWYEEANAFQCNAHGETYTAFHNVIKKYLEEGDRYKEFGTMQGVTAACALTKMPYSVELVDINFTRYQPYEPIFKQYCKENNIILKKYEMSSDSLGCASEVDMLLIDSKHEAGHMRRELAAHGYTVKKHIVAHDTYKISSLHKVLVEFCNTNPEWKVIEYFEDNVGYTHISKVL